MQVIDKIKAGGIAVVSLALVLSVGGFAAWVTHIVECLQEGEWGFLIAGALVVPIAIIHGVGVWFGWW